MMNSLPLKGLEEFSDTLSVWSESLKRPSASELGDSDISFTFFSGGLTVSLVMVRLVALCFFFLLVSILGDVVAVDGEGLVVAVPEAWSPPLEALTNFPPWLGRISIEAGL